VRIVEGLDELRPGLRRVVALGTFDGVHLGHQQLVQTAIEQAARIEGGISTIVTFEPMPLEVLRPDDAPRRLSGLGRRAALVAEQGPDELLVVRFDRELAGKSPEEFVADVLVERVGAVHTVTGQDYRFGKRAAGSARDLAEIGARHGVGHSAVPLLKIDNERVSSSWIRELVSQGEVAHAARLLGRDPWLDGAVVRGEGRGKGLGVPTANLGYPPGRIVPGRGVYAGFAILAPGEERHAAAISVGWNPTFKSDRNITVEAHLLDFDRDIYGWPMRLELRAFLRHELRFDSVDELVSQMQLDIAQARAVTAG
jgi:riboflavin kinase/FMN adenylyltransferase